MKRLTIVCVVLFVHGYSISFSKTGKADTVTVVDATKLKPFERRYIQYIQTDKGYIRFNSILTRKLVKLNEDNHDVWLTVQTYQSANAIDRDSSFNDYRTLLPLRYRTQISSEGHSEQVAFTNTEIINKVVYKGDSSVTIIKDNKKNYNAVILDDIITLLPLKMDAIFIVRAVNPGMRFSELTTTISVEGKEVIEISGLGKILCWKIRSHSGRGNGTLGWYSVKDLIQIKKEFELGNGMVFYRLMIV